MVDHFSIHDKDGAEDMLMGHRSRTPDERRQKILACVDHSKYAERVADYAT